MFSQPCIRTLLLQYCFFSKWAFNVLCCCQDVTKSNLTDIWDLKFLLQWIRRVKATAIFCSLVDTCEGLEEPSVCALKVAVGRDRSVGTATRYRLDGREIESRWMQTFRTRLDRSCIPPSHLYNGYPVSFLRVKQLGCGVDHPPIYRTGWRKSTAITLLPSETSWPVMGWILLLLKVTKGKGVSFLETLVPVNLIVAPCIFVESLQFINQWMHI